MPSAISINHSALNIPPPCKLQTHRLFCDSLHHPHKVKPQHPPTHTMNVYTTTLLLLLCIACTLESQAFVAPNSGRSATASFQRQMELLYKSSPNHDHSPVAKHYVDSFRNVMAAFLVGFAITFSPSTNPANHAHVWCVANAEETKVTLDPSERTENLQEGGGQQSLLTAPSLVGSQDDHEDSLVEQVWNLIDKYFIDQTFNGQVGITHTGQHVEIPVYLY